MLTSYFLAPVERKGSKSHSFVCERVPDPIDSSGNGDKTNNSLINDFDKVSLIG